MQINVVPTALDRVFVLETRSFADDRGYFLETYHRRDFEAHGIGYEFVQDNQSRSGQGVLRGLHYQDMRAPMGKLVRCSRGAILDVAVDLRAGSPTFGRSVQVELSDDNHRQLLIPAGFAHGFLVLSDGADVTYRCTGYYSPEAEGTLAWDDPEVGIAWPIEDPTVSDKDRRGASLADHMANPRFRLAEVLASPHG